MARIEPAIQQCAKRGWGHIETFSDGTFQIVEHGALARIIPVHGFGQDVIDHCAWEISRSHKWWLHAARELKCLFETHRFSAIWATFPDHGALSHSLGAWASKRWQVPWIADFRDVHGQYGSKREKIACTTSSRSPTSGGCRGEPPRWSRRRKALLKDSKSGTRDRST